MNQQKGFLMPSRTDRTRFPEAELLDLPDLDSPFPPLSPEEFKAVFRGHPGGVVVITASGPDGPVALTATSVASVSADPPLVVFSVSAQSSSTPALLATKTAVIHFIDADNLLIAKLGATSGINRFADTTLWTQLDTGEPVFHRVPVWIRVELKERLTFANSTVVVAQGLQCSLPATTLNEMAFREPLAYVDRKWYRLGHESVIV
jgi:flavin reductase (DIM6/NTAB) family NADH-FMN oxidoreductase RutF